MRFPPKVGQLVKTCGGIHHTPATPSPYNKFRAPFYMTPRQLDPTGTVEVDVTMLVVDEGSHFAQCMSPVGVVWFRIDNLQPL